MTMQCHTIEPNCSITGFDEAGQPIWEGPNTIRMGARDDETGEDEFLELPFDPQMKNAPSEIVMALVGNMLPGDPFPGQLLNNILWTWAVALDQTPSAVLVWSTGELQVRVSTAKIATIDPVTAELIPV